MRRRDLPTREELFELVWSKPTRQVAAELGMSDVALGKICRQLQIPKPPRGYWARVAAGQSPRRPALPAYLAEKRSQKKPDKKVPGYPPLSPKQNELFEWAVAEVGFDVAQPPFALHNRLLSSITPEFAASLVIFLHRQGPARIARLAASFRHETALRSVLHALIKRLMPLAAESVIIFKPRGAEDRLYENPSVIVRFTPALRNAISTMAAVARKHDLSYVARGLEAGDHMWRFRTAWDIRHYHPMTASLCVSPTDCWVEIEAGPDESGFVSETMSLAEVVPEYLLGNPDKELPTVLPRSSWRRHGAALRRFNEEYALWEKAYHEHYDLEREFGSDPSLAPALSLWLSSEQRALLRSAKEALSGIDEELAAWEDRLEIERARLARLVSDIHPGDVVIGRNRTGLVRLLVDRVHGYFTDDKASLTIQGRRFRKDGLPGKREDLLYLDIPVRE